MLRISYMEHRTNAPILDEVKHMNDEILSTRISTKIRKQYLEYVGHILRRVDGMERVIVVVKAKGERSRSRSPSKLSDRMKA